MEAIVKEMMAAAANSLEEMRKRFDSVRLGPIVGNYETITFRFDGQPYQGTLRGRNADCCVGFAPDYDAAIALRVYLDGHVDLISESQFSDLRPIRG